MNRRASLAILVGLTIILSSCALVSPDPLRERIEQPLEAGDEWDVQVKYWPDRFEDPYSRSDTPLVSRNHYTVLKSPGGTTNGRILVEADTEAYVLELNGLGNVELAARVLGGDTAGVVKTQAVLTNELRGRVLFAPDWSPDQPVFLFHPDLSAVSERLRVRFDRESLYSDDWIVQTMNSSGGTHELTLRHRPSRSRVEFHWPRGAVWWSRARWFRSGRIIATARRVRD